MSPATAAEGKSAFPPQAAPSDGLASASRWSRTLRDELGVGAVHPRLLALNSLLALIPYMAGKRLRPALYRLLGFRIGAGTVIYGTLRLWGGGAIYGRLRTGRSCRINTPCALDLNGTITLGDRVVIGHDVTILTAAHRMDDPSCRAGGHDLREVTIGDGAWVAAHAMILPGVTVGEGAVVAARSVVTRDVPPHTLVAGNPARPVRTLNPPGAEPGQQPGA